MLTFRQGQICIADLNPPHGDEMSKVRPVVVASQDELNEASQTVVVFPISTSVYREDPRIVFIKRDARNGLRSDGGIVPFHIRAISKKRLKQAIGRISGEQLSQALEVLRLTLNM